MTLTTELIRICDRPVTPPDLHRAGVHLLDWTGIVLATRHSEPERAFGKAACLPGGALTGLIDADPERAAFALGALGSLLEMDDLHRRSILHVGDVVCPAAWVAARASGASGADMLGALIAGYEVALRIGIAATAGGYTAWYNSSAIGVFGAAMAAARALGLDAGAQAYALGHAGMQTAGLWQCRLEPGHAKQLATAHAARAGITAARAAQAGLAAPLEILEGPLGVFNALYPGADPQVARADPKAAWHIHGVSFKPWSACRHTHPAIAAALRLRRDGEPLPLHIRVATYAAALDMCDQPAPQTAHAARFSLQHCVAIALARGAPTRAEFEDPACRDAPDIEVLRARVSLAETPKMTAAFPDRYAAEVTVTDADGVARTATALHAPGDPEDPLAEDALQAKFLSNCLDGGIPQAHAEALRDAICALPGRADLTDLTAALRAVTQP